MRRALKAKIRNVSLLGGSAVCILALIGSFLQRAASVWADLGEKNQQTLARITCRDIGPAWTDTPQGFPSPLCDISAIENDPDFESISANYVLDLANRYFIYNKSPLRDFWLDKSDVAFLRQFRQLKSVVFETGEQWKIYSEPGQIDNQPVEVMVAVMESSPWTMGENAVGADVPEQLRAEPGRILRQLKRPPITSRTDAWQVIDGKTGKVIEWSGDAPALYPGEVKSRSWMLHLREGELWLERSSRTGRLLAVSVQELGSLLSFVLTGLGGFLIGTFGAYPIAKRFIKTGITEPVSLDDAIKGGESTIVEFKREVKIPLKEKERQSLLKSIAAFANTEGGSLFIGIVDGSAEIVGVDATTPESQDDLRLALGNSISNSIRPPPKVKSIDFLSTKEGTVARVTVLSDGELHTLDGRVYKREGPRSQQLEDGDIARL